MQGDMLKGLGAMQGDVEGLGVMQGEMLST